MKRRVALQRAEAVLESMELGALGFEEWPGTGLTRVDLQLGLSRAETLRLDIGPHLLEARTPLLNREGTEGRLRRRVGGRRGEHPHCRGRGRLGLTEHNRV